MLASFSALVRSIGKSKRPRYSAPEGSRFYAVGDVHGCLRQFDRLLDLIADDLSERPVTTHLIMLGDLIDRGPDSCGVMKRLVEGPLPTDSVHLILGNHEESFLACYDGDQASEAPWLQRGGLETLASYGLDKEAVFSRSFNLMEALHAVVPPSHVEFMRQGHNYLKTGNYVFAHAGIRPGTSLKNQTVRDLRWIRSSFLDDKRDHGFVVVHGHTIVPGAQILPNRIAVDTGCYMTGRLSAAVIEEERVKILTVG